jgi:putative FmdB family regulatory protein
MPTYEYACGACGHQWEQVQRIVEAPIEVCPKCAQSAAHRLISGGTNFILKGGGWYSDLYSSSKSSAKTESSTPASTEGAAKTAAPAAESKTETKAAPATTPTPSTPASSAPSSSS